MHNDTSAADAASQRQQVARLVPALVGIAALAALIAPRMTPGLLPLLALPLLAPALVAHRGITIGALPPLIIGLGAFGAYLFVNALWAVDPLQGLGRAALFALIVALGLVVSRALPLTDDAMLNRIAGGIVLAVVAGAALLAIEIALDQPIRKAVVNLWPALRPPAKHVHAVDGQIVNIGLYTLNRNLAVLVLCLWPVLLLCRSWLGRERARLLGLVLLLLSAVAVFRSEHESSMLAMAGSAIVFAGMVWAAPVLRIALVVAWVAATLLVVPLATSAHQAGLHQASWLPGTARNRIVLWNVTAEKMRARPILGIGIESTKPLDEEAAETAVKREGDAYPQRTGRHAHNIFMQTWFELGAVGALLLLVVGVLALRAMAKLAADVQPYAFAAFASGAVIASFTWGMWQPWFMCAFGIWAVLIALSLEAAGRDSPRR